MSRIMIFPNQAVLSHIVMLLGLAANSPSIMIWQRFMLDDVSEFTKQHLPTYDANRGVIFASKLIKIYGDNGEELSQEGAENIVKKFYSAELTSGADFEKCKGIWNETYTFQKGD